MKYFAKWRNLFFGVWILGMGLVFWFLAIRDYHTAVLALVLELLYVLAFFGLWHAMKKKGIRAEVEIARVLGKDAKDALSFGDIGIITYDNEYKVTWTSNYFREHGIDLVNRKLTSWIENIRDLFEEDVDTITGESHGQVYEISKKSDAQILYVKNITELTELKQQLSNEGVVVGLMTLDNYSEYQSYENEELLNQINSSLRSSLISWAKANNMFFRRLRSDRYLVLCSEQTLRQVRKDNFTILQKIKDEADKLDVTITLSMVFAYGTNDYTCLDHMINELLELVQSRGGDQVAIKKAKGKVEFIGGNSEKNSQRSKVRVSIIGSSIQDLIHDAGKVFILGHVNTDYDCMGAALAVSNWVKALGREAFIVLKDVSRDGQLQETLDVYKTAVCERHSIISEEEALRMMDPEKDLAIMVDHGIPAISSGKNLLSTARKVAVIDHHRRSENFVNAPILAYVESAASSTAELLTELLQSSNISVPIYEAEATIMYLGLLVDTNRFKTHTSERTFQAAATLRSWGANNTMAERALQEDLHTFSIKNELVAQARPFRDSFMITASSEPVSRTLLSQVSDALLQVKGCKASFTIGINAETGRTAISARSDGSFNVQKIMETLGGGGHFAAAAAETAQKTPAEVRRELEDLLSDSVQ